jgi:hypothetical protein
MPNTTQIEPGIRGWLIVLTIFLFVVPGNLMAHAVSAAREFDSPVVRQFTDPAHPTYDPRWSAFIFSETAAFSILAGVSMLVLWPLFFLRHRFFPFAFGVIALCVEALLLTRAGLAANIPTVASPHRASIYSQTAIWVPLSLILATYVIRSRRAQITFRRRLMFYPAFPFFTRT